MQTKLIGCQGAKGNRGAWAEKSSKESLEMSPGDGGPSAQREPSVFYHIVHKEALLAVSESESQAWSSPVLRTENPLHSGLRFHVLCVRIPHKVFLGQRSLNIVNSLKMLWREVPTRPPCF